MDRLVALAVSRRYLMVGMFVAVLVGGLIAFKQLNIEAYPDPTPRMVRRFLMPATWVSIGIVM